MIMMTAGHLKAQDSTTFEADTESPTSFFNTDSQEAEPVESTETVSDGSDATSSLIEPSEETTRRVSMLRAAVDHDDESEEAAVSVYPRVKWGATVDMQVDKDMYDEFSQDNKVRLQSDDFTGAYRQRADDFWLRVALRGMYRYKYFESAFALRFYPYWTMRRLGKFQDGKDLARYLDVLEINQAYLKVFKEYEHVDNNFSVHLKIGRDGLLSTGSQLFGNYLELPTGGYGDGRIATVTGPFKNRKVFANMMEVGFTFSLGEMIRGKTSMMIGGNVNNQMWYTSPTPAISEAMDSKLTSGFTRGYQDFYLWKERIHLGAGFRVYTTKKDDQKDVPNVNDTGTTRVTFSNDNRYINGDWTFDFTFLPDCKFYSEFGFQKLGAKSSTGIIRPFCAGLTIPTAGVLDVLAIEVENVADTFFSKKSMRDPVGNRKDIESFAWGIVTEKLFLDGRVGVAWGVYTGNVYGDMQTSLRLTSNFN
jgi:hypothetical protein